MRIGSFARVTSRLAKREVPPFSGTEVAVVGVACRLPGGIDSLEALWAALRDGRDLVSTPSEERFDAAEFEDPNPDSPGRSYVMAGGFLDDITGFDVDFFGISPREATRIDPQQRLLLELSREAFDDAGIDPACLAGSATSVFVGASAHGYSDLQQRDPDSIDAYTMTGTSVGNTANRLSHVFDLRGPSMAVDTACSSSLVAVDLACRQLTSGECSLALAAGVQVMINPLEFVGYAKASMLSRSGRCRTFSKLADGYVRGEGGAVIVLKRLADALAEGDRVHGIIVGTAVNSCGLTPGLAHPNPIAQKKLLSSLYSRIGLSPNDLAYVEAHGTGTAVGDPAECQALGQALGQYRTVGRLPIGSIKTNIGHLESAAGIAGVLKGLTILRHRAVPVTLHAEPLNPAIDFADLNLEPATEYRTLNSEAGRVVGVNSFGFGGVNAHVVLAPAPTPAIAQIPEVSPLPVMVSARTPEGVREVARKTAAALGYLAGQAQSAGWYDFAWTSCCRRGAHAERAVVLADSPAEAVEELSRIGSGELPRRGALGIRAGTGRIAYVFSGNGSQWPGMGATMMDGDAEFRAMVAQIDRVLEPMLGWSVLRELKDPDPARMARTEVAQPLLLAVQLGIVASLRQRGIRPAAVVGHSVGEVAAAYCAGALDLRDACRVIAARSSAQATTYGRGRMAAVALSSEQAKFELRAYPGVEIAGVNSYQDVTLAGEAEELAALTAELVDRGVFVRDLGLNYAFHSRSMDTIRTELLRELSDLAPTGTTVPLVSIVTGTTIAGDTVVAEHWWRNIRQPVRFAEAIDHVMTDLGCDVLVEIGPHPTLGGYLRKLTSTSPGVQVLHTLSRREGGPGELDTTVAAILASGAEIDWTAWYPTPGSVVDLPNYPWQREHHYHGAPQWWLRRSADEEKSDHPLLGFRRSAPDPTWQVDVRPDHPGWLGDHCIAGVVILPAVAYAEMLLTAGRTDRDYPIELRDLQVTKALVAAWNDSAAHTTVQIEVRADDGAGRVSSTNGTDWSTHARCRIRRRSAMHPQPLDIDSARADLTATSGTSFYARARELGLDYGPAFRVLEELYQRPGYVLARYVTPSHLTVARYGAHPAVLDGALQAAVALLPDFAGRPYLPVEIGTVRPWFDTLPTHGYVQVVAHTVDARQATFDVDVVEGNGVVAMQLRDCVMRRSALTSTAPVGIHVTRILPTPAVSQSDVVVPVPRPSEVVSESRTVVPYITQAWRTDGYIEFEPRYKTLLAQFAVDAISSAVDGPSFSMTDLAAVASSHPGSRMLLDQLVGLGRAQNLIQSLGPKRPDMWRLAAKPDPTLLYRQLIREFPRMAPDLMVAAHCGSRLAAVLGGDQDPMDLLFSPTDRLAEHYYANAPILQYHNRLIQELMRAWLTLRPAASPVRILEVGAGTGGTTAQLLPLLPADRTRYTFSDVTAAFFPAARQRFSRYAYLDYRQLDLNDPAKSGLMEGSFDLVIASNVLHATADVAASLQAIAALLRDDGTLLALEAHDTHLLVSSFGLLESFWQFTDIGLRPETPLLTPSQWRDLLQQNGFDDIAIVGDEEPPARDDYSILLAHRVPRSQPTPAIPPSRRAWFVATPMFDAECDSVDTWGLADELRHQTPTATVTTSASVDADEWRKLLSRRNSCGDALHQITDEPTDVIVVTECAAVADGAAVEQVVQYAAMLRALAAAFGRSDHAGPTITVAVAARTMGPVPDDPVAAAVWGLARTMANEFPMLTVRRVCIAACSASERARLLAAELQAESDEDEVILTPAGRYCPRVADLGGADNSTPDFQRSPSRLAASAVGASYRLRWQPMPTAKPAAGEVAIAVQAVGINYRDVLVATGRMPAVTTADDTGYPLLGLECTGYITEVGPGVSEWRVGERVFALAPGCFASQVITSADCVGRIPDTMTFAAAATLPLVFVTVQEGLEDRGQLQRGETLLIHSAAGGVGLAALQQAQLAGARVIATAGTPARRDLLRRMGADHVLDSHGLQFVEQVHALTEDRGVDIVLNSLAGSALHHSVELLAPRGRFIELGKRDLLQDSALSLRPFSRSLAFFSVDVTPLLSGGPITAMLVRRIQTRVAAGDYSPLPYSVYPVERIEEALSIVEHSRHTGKIVVTFDQSHPASSKPQQMTSHMPERLDPRATYAIVGGTTGFGAETARWLARRGARRLALISRSGRTDAIASLLADLHKQGVVCEVYPADVADLQAMKALWNRLDAQGHPVRGVVHAAMILHDAPIEQVSSDDHRAVLAPKLVGATVLDRLTRTHPVDFFLVYSSISGLVGNINQSSYAAGNLAMEAIVTARRTSGLPGLAVQWGAISDSGYMLRNNMIGTFERLGFGAITTAEAFDTLDRVTADTELCAVHIGRADWARVRDTYATVAAPRFDLTATTPEAHTEKWRTPTDLTKLSGSPTALEAIEQDLTAIVANIMQTTPERIDRHRRLDHLGVDSLMATQLGIVLQRQYGHDFPVLELTASPGVADLAQRLAERVLNGQHQIAK
ncbi:type I polyketide synthase [Nocardia sp. JMUB6875]|uniref:SDR family NAD(P)-dependent oxidoreductase n=1 Tax=Nocardia sp. JMUB6875 TaxID=3158170 RepID=UPI0032E6D7E3